MKALHIALAIGLVSLVGTAAAGPAPENAPPRQAATELSAYLGVATSPVDEALAQHLDLPRGVGLVLDHVDPESAAADKLERHDVLHRLDDQLLVTHQQLAVLVRMHKPGDNVTLHLLRQGKPMTFTVALGGKELPPLDSRSWNLPQVRFGGPVVRPMRPCPDVPPNEAWENDMQDLLDQLQDQTRELRRRWGTGPDRPDEDRPRDGWRTFPGASAGGSSTHTVLSISRDGLTVTLTTNADGHKHLKAQDDQHKTVFDGPVNTDEELKAVPKTVRDKLDELEQMRRELAPDAAPPVDIKAGDVL
ncbi:MAG: PDZ domain-containing protein [Kiritimatiellae bacterium]|nr:PDZ domain-containing protein [Kiritimatiellia bacterium]